MVFFICNHCGESVKKPGVEKHYLSKCRNRVKNVSCMDCQKDFYKDDYVAHTRCISEAEKYSGKDFVAKASQNKGLKKQETWTEIVRSILENDEYKLSTQTCSIFQRLQNYENVPRKKQKFQNFVANCLRMPPKQAESVWNVLEQELEKMKQAKQQQHQQQQHQQQQQESQQLQEQKPQQLHEMVVNKSLIKREYSEEKEGGEVRKNKRSTGKEIKGFDGIARNGKEYGNGIADAISYKQLQIEKSPASLSLHINGMFKFHTALENLINKYEEGINISKLKEKFKKKYQKKYSINELNEELNVKYEKKFNKAMKKLSNKLNIVDDVVKPQNNV